MTITFQVADPRQIMDRIKDRAEDVEVGGTKTNIPIFLVSIRFFTTASSRFVDHCLFTLPYNKIQLLLATLC
jgi:hypothetical protein